MMQGHLVIFIRSLRQGRVAGFRSKNAAFDGMATGLRLRLGLTVKLQKGPTVGVAFA